MKRVALIGVMFGFMLVATACNPKLGLVTIDTNPQGATLYVNEAVVGDTPATFEFDMDKPVTLKLLKEGYQPKNEQITANWIKAEYQLGHYGKGDYMIRGEVRRGYEVRTTRDLLPATK